MATSARDYIADKTPPVTTSIDEPLTNVVRRMINHDFSQIPVVDSQNRPVGIITSDSIRQALFNFPIALHELPSRRAMLKNPFLVNQKRDLISVFDDMRDGYALIIDERRILVGILTSYDVAGYFRQRARDIYQVENIENKLKDYVLLAFGSYPEGEKKLDQAIQSMTNSSIALRQKFENAVRHYLSLSARDERVGIVSHHLNSAFSEHLDARRPPVQFDDLTLSNYIDLFLYRDHWERLQDAFGLEKSAVRHILQSVLETRNDLAHFRDISRAQSYQLRDCYALLLEHEEALQKAFATDVVEDEGNKSTQDEQKVPPRSDSSVPGKQERVELPEKAIQSKEPPVPIEDEPAPNDSRYAPLAIWLQNLPIEKNLTKPSFKKIEQIIGGKLPDSAYSRREWWANDSVGHVQSKQWLDVGWRVASVNMTKQVVRFARIKERQRAYIEFFSRLVDRLNEEEGFEEKQALPDGANWLYIKTVFIQGRTVASFNFAFGRQNIFRVELYIDTGEQALNKQLFDALHRRRDQIEHRLGHKLSWQRLDSKRASRVAWNLKGHITDDEPQLEELREKATMAMVRSSQVMEKWLKELGPKILDDYESSD